MTRFAMAALVMILASSATAHHSLAGFDMSDPVEIEGELVSIKWRNPHLGFTIRVVDEDGESKNWNVHGWGSAYSMGRTGVSRDEFINGDRVRLAGFRSSRRADEMLVSHMLLSSGVEAIIRPDAEPRWAEESTGGRTNWIGDEGQVQNAAAENRGIFRTWSTSGYFNSLSTTTLHYSFTESAIAGRSSWDQDDNYVTRCEPPGMPQIMSQPHPYEFVEQGDVILLRGEVWGITRTIFMDPAAASGELAVPNLGRSIGRWDGRTLIIETTDIAWPYFDYSGTPQSDAVSIREEFTLSEDQVRLDYRQVVTDPATFTEPATLETHWLALGEEIIPWVCPTD
jgi:hypothetical protein